MKYSFARTLNRVPVAVMFFLAMVIVVGVLFIPVSFFCFDKAASLYVASHVTPHATDVFKDISLLASWKGIIVFYLLLGVYFYIMKVKTKTVFYKERFAGFCFGLSLFVTSGACVQVIKRIVGRPRPNMLVSHGEYGIPHFGHVWTNLHSYYNYVSFPSGHSQTAASLGIAIALLFPRLSVLVAIYIMTIMTARVMVLAHYPSDVTGGLVVVCGCFFVLRSYYLRYFS